MRILSAFVTLSLFSGCALCDRCDDRDDLPPKPRLGDRLDPGSRDDRGPNDDRPPLHWFAPDRKGTTINPPIPELPPQREPTAPRAEDPSWRNR